MGQGYILQPKSCWGLFCCGVANKVLPGQEAEDNHPNRTWFSSWSDMTKVSWETSAAASSCDTVTGKTWRVALCGDEGGINDSFLLPSRSWHGISAIDRGSTHLWCGRFVAAHSHQEERLPAAWEEAMQIRHEKIVQRRGVFFFILSWVAFLWTHLSSARYRQI